MGQKVNPIIFRLGILKNEWRSKYFEKNLEEFSLYSFQNIKIKRYLDQFLNESGLILHDYKMYFNETSLHLYVSYFVTSKPLTIYLFFQFFVLRNLQEFYFTLKFK